MTLIQQQRLIGSILLLCLISAVAYFLLSNIEDRTAIEAKPETETEFSSTIKLLADDIEVVDEPLVEMQDHEANQQQSSVSENLTEPVSGTEPAPTPASGEQLWMLQLGSFLVRANAVSLNEKVKQLGYDAYMETLSSDGKPIYRVCLKATSNRNELEKAAEILKTEFKLSPQIRRLN